MAEAIPTMKTVAKISTVVKQPSDCRKLSKALSIKPEVMKELREKKLGIAWEVMNIIMYWIDRDKTKATGRVLHAALQNSLGGIAEQFRTDLIGSVSTTNKRADPHIKRGIFLTCGMQVLHGISLLFTDMEDVIALAVYLLEDIGRGGREYVRRLKKADPTISPSAAAHEVLETWCSKKPEEAYGGNLMKVLEQKPVNPEAAWNFKRTLLSEPKSGSEDAKLSPPVDVLASSLSSLEQNSFGWTGHKANRTCSSEEECSDGDVTGKFAPSNLTRMKAGQISNGRLTQTMQHEFVSSSSSSDVDYSFSPEGTAVLGDVRHPSPAPAAKAPPLYFITERRKSSKFSQKLTKTEKRKLLKHFPEQLPVETIAGETSICVNKRRSAKKRKRKKSSEQYEEREIRQEDCDSPPVTPARSLADLLEATENALKTTVNQSKSHKQKWKHYHKQLQRETMLDKTFNHSEDKGRTTKRRKKKKKRKKKRKKSSVEQFDAREVRQEHCDSPPVTPARSSPLMLEGMRTSQQTTGRLSRRQRPKQKQKQKRQLETRKESISMTASSVKPGSAINKGRCRKPKKSPGVGVVTIPNEFKQVTVFIDEDIMKVNKNIYPVLARMAKAALGRPVGSITVEMANFKTDNQFERSCPPGHQTLCAVCCVVAGNLRKYSYRDVKVLERSVSRKIASLLHINARTVEVRVVCEGSIQMILTIPFHRAQHLIQLWETDKEEVRRVFLQDGDSETPVFVLSFSIVAGGEGWRITPETLSRWERGWHFAAGTSKQLDSLSTSNSRQASVEAARPVANEGTMHKLEHECSCLEDSSQDAQLSSIQGKHKALGAVKEYARVVETLCRAADPASMNASRAIISDMVGQSTSCSSECEDDTAGQKAGSGQCQSDSVTVPKAMVSARSTYPPGQPCDHTAGEDLEPALIKLGSGTAPPSVVSARSTYPPDQPRDHTAGEDLEPALIELGSGTAPPSVNSDLSVSCCRGFALERRLKQLFKRVELNPSNSHFQDRSRKRGLRQLFQGNTYSSPVQEMGVHGLYAAEVVSARSTHPLGQPCDHTAGEEHALIELGSGTAPPSVNSGLSVSCCRGFALKRRLKQLFKRVESNPPNSHFQDRSQRRGLRQRFQGHTYTTPIQETGYNKEVSNTYTTPIQETGYNKENTYSLILKKGYYAAEVTLHDRCQYHAPLRCTDLGSTSSQSCQHSST